MKVVALVSGGKDSFYSMFLAAQEGHEIVAVANLCPQESEPDDLDSYMYQTVGHQMIEAYAECMGVPVFRRAIVGTSTRKELQYTQTEGDEVEDLFLLLSAIKEAVPGLSAVSSGAIASDYQRLRVESVCSRLGLASLAYMWHLPQADLLSGMIDSGIDAILVKVAALGLDPHKHLGRSISQLQPYLHALNAKYGSNVCGEGGEYETLVTDCPMFKYARIELTDSELVVLGSGVAYLRPTSFTLVRKDGAPEPLPPGDVRVVAEDWVPRRPTSHSWDHGEMPLGMVHDEWVVGIERRESSTPSGGFVQLLLRPVSRMPADGTDATVDALTLALETLEEELSRLGLDLSRHCMFVHLYLGNMGHFAAANKAYSHAFPLSNPPSRSCVQVMLPHGCPLMMDVLLATTARAEGEPLSDAPLRSVLHVQSISSWAPSCIGPYSQATSYRGLIYMAGSMPLDPSSMLVAAPGDVGAQARKALANAEAVAIALGASMLRGCLSLTVFVAAEAAETGGVLEALAAIEAELDGAVAAAAAAGNIGSAGFSSDDEDAGEDAGEGARLTLRVDPYLAEPSIAAPLRPTVVVVVVPALPRGCLVEVEPLLVDVAHFDALAAMPCASSSESGSEGGKEGDSGDGQEGEEGKEGEDGMEGEEAGGSSSTPETAAAAAPASPMAQASEAPAPAADAPPSPAPSPSPLAQQHQPAAAAADLSVSVPASPAVAPPAATPSPRLPPLSPREPSGSPAPLARSGHGGTHAHGASSRLGARVSGGGGVDDVIGPLGSGLLGGAVAAAAAAAASGGAGSSKGHRRRGSVTSSAFMTLEGFGRGAGAGGGGGREKEREREDIVATVRGGLSEALINAALSSAALSSLASAGSGGDVGVLEAVLTGAFSGFDGSVASGSPAALPGSRALSLSQPLPAVVDGTVPGESLVTTVVHQGVLLLSLLHLPVGVFQGPGDLHARLHRATAAVLSQHGMSLSNVVRAIAFVDVSKVPNLTGPPAPDGGAGEAGSGCQSGGGGEQGQEDEAQPHFHVTWVPVLSVSSSACSNCAAIVEVLAQL